MIAIATIWVETRLEAIKASRLARDRAGQRERALRLGPRYAKHLSAVLQFYGAKCLLSAEKSPAELIGGSVPRRLSGTGVSF